TGPLVLGTGPPVDTIAQPCGLVAPFYARWAESLWRPPLPPEVPGYLLTDACRQAVGGPADDGLGATLVAEIGRPDRGARAERFTLALATLAAFAEGGGDPAVTARVLSSWTQRSKGTDECVDSAIEQALGKSRRVRAAGAEVLAAVYEGKRCGFTSVRYYVCDASTVLPPDV